MKRIFPHLLILTMAGAGAASGLLSSLVFGLADLAFRLAPIPASGDIVIVAIDRRSLDRLGPWPWPRRHHAGVLDWLGAAGAHRIALDIDVSGRTNATDDQALANAIGRANGGRVNGGRATSGVVLPVFRQAGKGLPVHRSPYAPFALGARLGSTNVMLEADGRTRRYPSGDGWNGGTIPSLASLLAGKETPREGSFFLDYGIQRDSVPRLSYSDILTGNFRGDAIKGKTIIIGAMEAGLGDRLTVPVHGLLSGPLVHALAYESLVQGRHIYGKSALFMVIAAFLLCFSAGRIWEKFSWRTGLRSTGA